MFSSASVNIHCSGTVLLCVMAPCFNTVLSQADVSARSTVYGRGRIHTVEGLVYFSSLTSSGDVFVYRGARADDGQRIAADQVMRVDIKSGSRALEYGAAGGLLGFVGAYLGAKRAEAELDRLDLDSGTNEVKDAMTGVVIGITALSAVVGALIGRTQEKYKTVYRNPRFAIQAGSGGLRVVATRNFLMLSVPLPSGR